MLEFEAAVQQEAGRLEQEYPTAEDAPSCMKLLDDFFLCYAVGSQMKSLYRSGQSSVCSHKFEDFKFCLSNKSLSAPEKRSAWIRRRAEWWALRRMSGSSEDVWDIRTEPLKNFPPEIISSPDTQPSNQASTKTL